jgi:predicted LPLAT superfamily acyltransferase
MVDRLASLTGRFSIENINAVNDEDFRKFENNKKGAILLISHLGNFEICRVASQKRSKAHFNVITHNANSQKINKALESLSKNNAVTIIEEKDLNLPGIIKLKEKVDEGEFIVIAGDRVPVKNDTATVVCDFLGEKARFPIGPFVISKVLSCPIITLYCLKNKKKYDVFFKLLSNKIEFNRSNRREVLSQSVQQYVNNLEQHVKIAPFQWYNFHKYWDVNSENKNDK